LRLFDSPLTSRPRPASVPFPCSVRFKTESNNCMLIVDDNRWMDKAHCANNNVSTVTFFEKYEKGNIKTKEKIVAMCDSICSVNEQCLEYGIATKSTGLFGGHYMENGRLVRGGRLARTYLEDNRDANARKKVVA